MAFCIHCGSEVASDATFCHSCGNALQAAGAETAPPPAPEPEPEPVASAEAPVESGASWTSESQVDSGASSWASSPAPEESSWGTPTPSSSWASTPEVTETPQTVDSGASSWGTSESSWSAPQSTWGTPESTAPLAEPEPAPPGSWTPTTPAAPTAETSSWSAPTPTPPPAETGWPPSLSSSSSGSAVVPPTPAAGVPNYLVASIVTTVLSMACCGCLPIGAISLIFAAQANSKAALGLADEAMRNAGLAKTWLIVAWVLMGLSILLWIGYFALILVAGNL